MDREFARRHRQFLRSSSAFFHRTISKKSHVRLTSKKAWILLCESHFGITPLPGLDPKKFYRGQLYYIRFQNLLASNREQRAQQYLTAACVLNNYKALDYRISKAIESEDFVGALQDAQKVADMYLTPGYLLISKVYFSKSSIGHREANIQCLRECLINLNLASLLLPHAEIAVKNSQWKIDEDAIREFASTCDDQLQELNTNLERLEGEIKNDTKIRFKKIVSEKQLVLVDTVESSISYFSGPK